MRVIANQKRHGGNAVAYFFRIIAAALLDFFHAVWILLSGPLIVAGIVLVVAFIIIYAKYGASYKECKAFAEEIVRESEPYDFRMEETTGIYDSEGTMLAKLSGGADSIYLTYVDIPKDAVNAFVAVEDKTFWKNNGVDLKGVLRVAANYVFSRGDEVAGASTITQQLARTVYLSREVSIERKIKELFVAKGLTKKYSKQQLMEYYINTANFGNAIYGLEAAARSYFNKGCAELTLAETAYLCALPNRPTYFNPYVDKERAIPRQQKILKDMRDQGYITSVQYENALQEEIEITPKRTSLVPEYNYETTYAIDCAIRYLMRLDGFTFRYSFESDSDYEEYKDLYDEEYELERTNLYSGGYKVVTSLDTGAERSLQEVLDRELEFEIEQNVDTGIYAFQGAMTAIDNATGKVIAVVGGRSQDYLSETYALNRAWQSYRQPGSSVKPLIVYTPALMQDYTADSPLKDIDVKAAQEGEKSVAELSGQTFPLRNAVVNSRNGCAMYLFSQIGPKNGLSYLQKMEFERIKPSDYVLSSALGTLSVSTTEMAGAYSTLGNGGMFREVTCLTSMTDKHGRELYEEAAPKQVYDRSAAAEMIDILEGVISEGTAKGMEWETYSDMPAAGKTGTTNDNKDGWFCGLTPYYTLTVWMGFDNPRTLEELTGGSYPATVWREGMLALIDSLPVKEFE